MVRLSGLKSVCLAQGSGGSENEERVVLERCYYQLTASAQLQSTSLQSTTSTQPTTG